MLVAAVKLSCIFLTCRLPVLNLGVAKLRTPAVYKCEEKASKRKVFRLVDLQTLPVNGCSQVIGHKQPTLQAKQKY